MNYALSINGVTCTSSQTLNVNVNNYFANSITPATRSPTLKRNITIAFSSNFPYTLSARSDFTVNITNTNNTSIVKHLNVIDVFDANKSIVVKFGGAYSGNYSF